MANPFITQLFISGFRLIDGGDLNNLVVQLTNAIIPESQLFTDALVAGVIPANRVVGAGICYWKNTGATPGNQQFPSAATLFAAIPGGQAILNAAGQINLNFTSTFRVIDTGAGTLTLTQDAGATITIVGTAATATNTWRDYCIQFGGTNLAPTATVTSVGSGVSP